MYTVYFWIHLRKEYKYKYSSAGLWIQEGKNLKLTTEKPGLGICSSLIRSSLIRSFRSFYSNQMSDCERFSQIAQDKWATVSEYLRYLIENELPLATL